MQPELVSLINSLYAHAFSEGLTESLSITIDYGDENDTNGKDVKIIVSRTEPTISTFANILWLNASESSVDYLQLLLRTSKDPSEYNNTWTKLTSLAELNIDQYYDAEDSIRTSIDTKLESHDLNIAPHKNYKVITENGGSLVNKLSIRQLVNSQAYELTEAIPRKTLVDALNSQTNGFYAIIQSLNMRVNTNSSEIALLKSKVLALENNTGGGNSGTPVEGAQFFVHTQNTIETEWIINHNLNSLNLIVNVWVSRVDTNSGNTVYYEEVPDEKIIFDENFVIVTFAGAVSGKVIITAL